MDEIDAALDFKNVSIVANYIKVEPVLHCTSPQIFNHHIFSCELIYT